MLSIHDFLLSIETSLFHRSLWTGPKMTFPPKKVATVMVMLWFHRGNPAKVCVFPHPICLSPPVSFCTHLKPSSPPSTQRTIAVDEIIGHGVIDMFGKVSRSSVASARRVTQNIVISHDARSDLNGSGSNTSSKLQDVSLRKSTDEVGSVACDVHVSLGTGGK